MKMATITGFAVLASALAFGAVASADNSCDQSLFAAAQAQAQIDFPGVNVTFAAQPALDVDSYNTYTVSVLAADPSQVLAYYDISVDETCHAMFQGESRP